MTYTYSDKVYKVVINVKDAGEKLTERAGNHR